MRKTLFEELLKEDIANHENKRGFDNLDNAQVFMINEVAEYFYDQNMKYWDIQDFPNLAPVFENCYFEYSFPNIDNFGWVLKKNVFGNRKIGILIKSTQLEAIEDDVKWALEVYLFDKISDDAVGSYKLIFVIALDKNGNCIPFPGRGPGLINILSKSSIDDDILQTQLLNKFNLYAGPAFLAISFMHCKNIRIVSQGKGTNTGKRNRHTAKIRFHTLQIDPIRKILETEGNIKQNGLKLSMHLCRGHFKNFTDDKPLFGKITGTYWWNSQVRGKVQNGIVMKDYQVNSPESN